MSGVLMVVGVGLEMMQSSTAASAVTLFAHYAGAVGLNQARRSGSCCGFTNVNHISVNVRSWPKADIARGGSDVCFQLKRTWRIYEDTP